MRNDALLSADPARTPVTAERIDLLYRLGRHHLFLPFAALCVANVLYNGFQPRWLAVVPLLLQIAGVVLTGMLERAYARRDPADGPLLWARRYMLASAGSGLAWGIGAFIWFVPHASLTNAIIVLAFLGMTAAEFIARGAYRPAYIAHAALSLGPLAFRLMMVGTMAATFSAVLVIFFGGILLSYCDGLGAVLDESIRLRRHNGDLVGLLTREKAAAENARDMAEASTRAKSAFVANISHEIRTPLNALLGMAQLLERSELDRAQKSHVKVLLEAGRGLKVLLDDVIALSRDEGGDRSDCDDDCDAAQAARTVARLLQPRAWEKQLKLGVAAANDLPRVAADPRRVRQILLKLADNALKFTQRGCVELHVEQDCRSDDRIMLRFSVTDTGLGIAPETAALIFEPFAAGDTSYTRRQEGAGLGLAVAKRTVEQLGGEIGFESEPGRGSTFWFTVPALEGAAKDIRDAHSIAGDAPPAYGLSLLLWCDDAAARTQIVNMLQPFGNRIVMPDALADAIAAAGREKFDAIVVSASGADSMAAAPGVSAPLLAILMRGSRLPAAVDAVLRWPAPASALYESLRNLLGRTADLPPAASASGQQAAIDAPVFAALEKSLGLSTLIEILHSYIETAEQLCASLAQASDTEGWEDAMRIAQDIAGAAGGLGLAAMTASARAFAQKVRDGESATDLQSAAREVVGEHARVRGALANLYPELAA